MMIRGISWVGVKTDSFLQMREFFAGLAGLVADFEARDFAVFRLPNGDKVEIFGPAASDSAGPVRAKPGGGRSAGR